MKRKVAIVLCNMGGPDSLDTVRPFLRNLFADRAIMRVVQPLRWFLAELISRRREREAQSNYALMGGASPLLAETEKQGNALEQALARLNPVNEFRCFVAMRYWHPFTHETARRVAGWNPDETILLPLYPHFSSTTTGSSLAAWGRAYPYSYKTICCYADADALTDAHADAVMAAWKKAGKPENVSLLMSAHGLPEKIIAAGDPYQQQIERMGLALQEKLPEAWETQVCYQSRVGPLQWIEPSTEAMVRQAANAGKHLIVAPIAFVSEHIETLVELDIEYRDLAMKEGAAGYSRVAALGTDTKFIALLADLVTATLADSSEIRSCRQHRVCSQDRTDCPHRSAE